MSVNLGAADAPGTTAEKLRGWPEDTALYDAQEIGDFVSDGYVAVTGTPERAPSCCWGLSGSSVDDPERFGDDAVGYFFMESFVADDAVRERLESPPDRTPDRARDADGVDLAAPNAPENSTEKLRGWPEDTALYDAQEIGDFVSDGYVAVTRTPDRAPSCCWGLSGSSVDRPERFGDDAVGYFFMDSFVADDVVRERLESPPDRASARDPGPDRSRGGSGDTEVFDSGTDDGSDDTEVFDPGAGDDGTGDTEVFGGTGDAADPADDGPDSSATPAYCPGCGTALDEYPDVAYCPGCGREL